MTFRPHLILVIKDLSAFHETRSTHPMTFHFNGLFKLNYLAGGGQVSVTPHDGGDEPRRLPNLNGSESESKGVISTREELLYP
jgi:hypothetical protein